MSYLVLARKWRPRSFAELVGQDHVRQALVNALNRDQLHHAYLFSGTRGVGKTTVARIFAKALNCEQGVSAEPCGECTACKALDEGRFFDLIEVDAASRTGVDDTRELLENVQYAPTQGRYKVYLIDEVHMFSASSFNALLKTLEEPPAHVKFLFATTDAQKLPVTVLSRCLRFNLHRIPPELLMARMQEICGAEQVTATDTALREIALAAEGSLRDALSLLDQTIAFLGGSLDLEGVREMLGTLSPRHAADLIEAVGRGDGAQVLEQVAAMAPQVPDFSVVINELITLLHQVAVRQLVPQAQFPTGTDVDQIDRLAQGLSKEDVQLYYQIAVAGRRDLPHLPDARSGVEMTLLRMLAFRPAPGGDVQRPSEAMPASGAPASDAEQPGPRQGAAADGEAQAPIDAAKWQQTVGRLGLSGMSGELAANTVLIGRSPGRIDLQLAAAHAPLLTDGTRGELAAALGELLGEAVTLSIQLKDESLRDTPAARQRAEAEQRLREAAGALAQEPAVEKLRQAFGAELDAGRARLLE